MSNRRYPFAVSAFCTHVLRTASFRATLIWCFALVVSVQMAMAAPFAAYVMDARDGSVIHSQNADTKLHPASLTKMMTLYVAFQAIERGQISLDTVVTVSANAANQQPSRLGLRRGQKIQMRYLLRAAAIKSANDAATAIGEAISGTEAEFARLMTRTAHAMGMASTTFRNANGLTASGHLSTARDMSVLGRHVLYDYPQYYNLFSRRSADAGIATVRTTNARFLDSYDGADGIKTGYTTAAGFNLVASARRGNKRIIATVFGGTSTAHRNARVAELLDLGFSKAGANVRVRQPARPPFGGSGRAPAEAAVAVAAAPGSGDTPGGAAKTIRISGAVQRSPRPNWRPGAAPIANVEVARAAAPPEELMAAIQDSVDAALEDVAASVAPGIGAPLASRVAPPRPDRPAVVEPDVALAAAEVAPEAEAAVEVELAEAAPAQIDAQPGVVMAGSLPPGLRPPARPARAPASPEPQAAPVLAEAVAVPPEAPAEAEPVLAAARPAPARPEAPADRFARPEPAAPEEDAVLIAEADSPAPQAEPVPLVSFAPETPRRAVATPGEAPVRLASIQPETFTETPAEPQVVTRLSTSGGRQWGVNVGLYGSEYEAERVLLTTALKESATLGRALRKVARSPRGFQANFVGMTEDMAVLACSRLNARNISCNTLSPG